LAFDPTLGKAHAALAGLHQANWRGAEAEQTFLRAYQLSQNDADVAMLYGRFKRYRAEYEEAIRLNGRAVELDPNVSNRHTQLALAYRFANNHEAAVLAFRNSERLNPTGFGALINFASSEAALGNYDEAIKRLQVVEQFEPSAFRLPQIALVYRQTGRPDDAMRLFLDFEQQASDESVDEGAWVRAYLAVGNHEQALERLESAADIKALIDVATLTELAANPWGDPELERPEFRELLDVLWDE
jgi:tetratricopeptide (TPR) repeat protein